MGQVALPDRLVNEMEKSATGGGTGPIAKKTASSGGEGGKKIGEEISLHKSKRPSGTNWMVR